MAFTRMTVSPWYRRQTCETSPNSGPEGKYPLSEFDLTQKCLSPVYSLYTFGLDTRPAVFIQLNRCVTSKRADRRSCRTQRVVTPAVGSWTASLNRTAAIGNPNIVVASAVGSRTASLDRTAAIGNPNIVVASAVGSRTASLDRTATIGNLNIVVT